VRRYAIVALSALALCGVGAVAYAVWRPDAPPAPAPKPAEKIARKQPQGRMSDDELVDGALDALPAVASPGSGPDIVVIVLDTLRADRLARFGGAGVMPRLDAWSKGAKVYTRATADGAWTLPSHASLFTGLSPRTHGVHESKSRATATALPPGTPTVAGALSAAGWRTVGIAANRAYLDARSGLDQGFDVWLCEQIPVGSRAAIPAERVADMGARVLARERTAPVFLFLNFMDVHPPWVAHKGYASGEVDPALLPNGELGQAAIRELERDPAAGAEARAAWNDAYDASARYLDAQVGELLDRLPALGVGEEDVVVVLSDHGEQLGEHQATGHAHHVWEELVHVPILVRGPGIAPGDDETPIQHHDVATMLLKAAGLPPLPGAEAPDTLRVVEALPENGRRRTRMRRAFVDGDHKLVIDPREGVAAYDLKEDPGELEPVGNAAWVSALEATGRAWVEARPMTRQARPAEEEDREALEALGYVQ
jgi:arylsulfatase A-like enzyme